MTSYRRELLRSFLLKFDQSPIVLSESNKQLQSIEQSLLFPITYFGKCFLEGYRIMEKIGKNFFLLSKMEFINGGNLNFEVEPQHAHVKHGKFRILCIQFDAQLNQDRTLRESLFSTIKSISKYICESRNPAPCPGVQIHFIFTQSLQFSTASMTQIQKNLRLGTQKFYNRNCSLNKKQSLRRISDKQQGTKLHQFIQILVKGEGNLQNNKYIEDSILHQFRYQYDIEMFINSIYFIIGREIIQGGYVNISAEKWMRKYTMKKFRKFDLLLRNRQKSCIIDWKISRMGAYQKINTFMQKNLQYIQLARKQYNSQVQLKFYCIHSQTLPKRDYHLYTSSTYNYTIQQVQIQDCGKQYIVNQDGMIQISQSQSQGEMEMEMEKEKEKEKGFKGKQKPIFDRISGEGAVGILYNKKTGGFQFDQRKETSWANLRIQQINNAYLKKQPPNPSYLPPRPLCLPQSQKPTLPVPPPVARPCFIQIQSIDLQGQQEQCLKPVSKQEQQNIRSLLPQPSNNMMDTLHAKVDAVGDLDLEIGRKRKRNSTKKQKSKQKNKKKQSSQPEIMIVLSDSSDNESIISRAQLQQLEVETETLRKKNLRSENNPINTLPPTSQFKMMPNLTIDPIAQTTTMDLNGNTNASGKVNKGKGEAKMSKNEIKDIKKKMRDWDFIVID